MSLDLTDMRELLRKGLGGLDSSEMSDDEADRYLNMSLWELDGKFPFKEKECFVTTTTVDGQRDYSLPSDLDAIRSVAIVDSDEELTFKLIKIDPSVYDEIRDTDADDEDRPTHYMRLDDGIYLHPVPDDAYTLQITMWRTVASLKSGSVTDTGLPRNWDEMVVEGAITRAHFYNQDYNLARQSENFRVGKIRGASTTEAKEERDYRYAGLQVLHDEPDGRQ